MTCCKPPEYMKLFQVNGAKIYLEMYDDENALDNISFFKKLTLWKSFLIGLSNLLSLLTFGRFYLKSSGVMVDEIIYLSKEQSSKIRELLELVAKPEKW